MIIKAECFSACFLLAISNTLGTCSSTVSRWLNKIVNLFIKIFYFTISYVLVCRSTSGLFDLARASRLNIAHNYHSILQRRQVPKKQRLRVLSSCRGQNTWSDKRKRFPWNRLFARAALCPFKCWRINREKETVKWFSNTKNSRGCCKTILKCLWLACLKYLK